MKKIFKTLGSIILSSAIIVSSFNNLGNNIYAQSSEIYTDTADLFIEGAVTPITDYFVPSEDNSFISKLRIFAENSVEQVLYDGLKSYQNEIDLSKFNLTREQLKSSFENVTNSCPELFFVSGTYQYYSSDNQITILVPAYLYDQPTVNSMSEYYNEQIKNIIDLVNPSWSDLEKIIFIHDYLAQNFEYDTSYQIYDSYNFFKQKKGVCQAYTSVFCGLMNELGIEVGTASSDKMVHIWNTVKLNGKWYHVDVTWDDPISDYFSLAHHNNLLLSDTAIKNSGTGHYDWISENTCSDTTYDNAYWKNTVNSPFSYADGKWYYTAFNTADNNAYLYSTGNITNSGSQIHSLGKWFLIRSNSYWTSAYSGLCAFNNKIYFNTQDAVYYYNTSNGEVSELCKPAASGKIFGLRINDSTLTYGLTNDYSSVTAYTKQLEAPVVTPEPTPIVTPEPTPIVTINPSTAKPGDINFDDSVDLTDVLMILKAAVGITQLDEAQTKAADVNNDSVVTLEDTLLTLKIALGIS